MSSEQSTSNSHEGWAALEMIGDITMLPLKLLDRIVEDSFEF